MNKKGYDNMIPALIVLVIVAAALMVNVFTEQDAREYRQLKTTVCGQSNNGQYITYDCKVTSDRNKAIQDVRENKYLLSKKEPKVEEEIIEDKEEDLPDERYEELIETIQWEDNEPLPDLIEEEQEKLGEKNV